MKNSIEIKASLGSELVSMQITGLEITLRRINNIESTFQSLLGGEDASSNFENTLQNSIEESSQPSGNFSLPSKTSTTTSLPEISSFSSIPSMSDVSSSSRPEIEGYIKKYSKEYGVDENLVRSVVKAESGFNPNAKSPVGAIGLMQLMPATARSMGVNDPYNAEQNIQGGTKYLKGLLDRFGGDKEKAVAAYNAGAGAVNKYGGVPPYRETQNYVKKVLGYQNELSSL